MIDFSDDNEQLPQKPSKSSLKRHSSALQGLAAELAALSPAQLQHMDLPEGLLKTIKEASTMPPKGARKRMIKYIGGLLREMDAEPIKEELAKLKSQSIQSARELHQIERWREQLINDDDSALTEFLSRYPHADRQQLRQLIRNAQKEQQAEKPPRFSRQLFRYLKEIINQSSTA